MNRAYYDDSISNFLKTSPEEIIGKIALKNEFSLEQTQKDAWLAEIIILKEVLPTFKGSIYFEYGGNKTYLHLNNSFIVKRIS